MSENESAPAPKRVRRGAIVGGVVAVVVVVAAIGAFVWHEQPSFCNAICHTPMDGYLETYEATPGQPATDKWAIPWPTRPACCPPCIAPTAATPTA